jgi:hypothetical protein
MTIGVDSADQVRRAQGRRAATQSVWTLPTRSAERRGAARQPNRRGPVDQQQER